MPASRRLALPAAAALVLAAPADAAAPLGAVRLRAGDHPAFVRVVADLAGRTIGPNDVATTDANPFDGAARITVGGGGARARARAVASLGVRARVVAARAGLVLTLSAPPRRFKYVSYEVLHAPDRLVVDLWKSAPPAPGAAVMRARQRCLALTRFVVTPRRVSVAGRERFLFEHTLVVRLRGARGGAVAQRPLIAVGGRWSTSL
ncbi:MAG: hypothetical protein ICV64_12175, partial [Thermoleophilia bacterium]|nr:hypothetical protein [Thermoleophilia bacterium]